jgi:hypothetical protein
MHIRLALAAFKAQYGYETCALETLESKLIRHSPLSPYSDAHRYAKHKLKRNVARSTTSSNEYPESSSSTERNVRSSSRPQIPKAYDDYGKSANKVLVEIQLNT